MVKLGVLRPRRRWLRFSLRFLFGLTTAVALFFAWLGHQYREGQRVKATIESMGGSATIWSHWDHRWGRAIGANLSGTEIGDRELAEIAGLPTLRMLLLEDTRITDEGLAHLRNLEDLHLLFISDTAVSDRGLEHLEDVDSLTFLQAHRTKITDEGVAKLQRALRELEVYYTAP